MSHITTAGIINCCKKFFSTHGIPQLLYTDSGTQFLSHEFNKFCDSWGIILKTSSPHFHQSNGLAERAVRTAKTLMQKCKDEKSDYHLALLNLRNTPRNGLASPAQLLFSRRTRTLLATTQKALVSQVVDGIPEKIAAIRQTKKSSYDKHSKQLIPLIQGDVVRVETDVGFKLLGTVIEVCDKPRSYVVQVGDKRYRRNRRQLLKVNAPSPVADEEIIFPNLETPNRDNAQPKTMNLPSRQEERQPSIRTRRIPSYLSDYELF